MKVSPGGQFLKSGFEPLSLSLRRERKKGLNVGLARPAAGKKETFIN